MILYDYRCESGHLFEAAVKAMSSPAPACPDCGAATGRVITRVRMSGQASTGHSRNEMPKSWTGMGGGHPDAVQHWRNAMTKREKLEEKYPELGGDRRPILAHEGIFRGRPLRAGDDIAASVTSALKEQKAKSKADKIQPPKPGNRKAN